MNEQTLTSLAVLTVNWDHGKDAIESFIPIVAECVRKNGDGPVSLVELQRSVEREAGIKIPSGALQTILGRCARRGLVQKQNRVYVPLRRKLDQLNYGPIQAEALRHHRCLVNRLREFARKQHEIEWTQEEADANLLAWLQDGSLPVLVAATEGDPLTVVPRQSRRTKHVISSFAGYLSESDPTGFACLETVVKGFILSGVLYYPDMGTFETRFDELDVYCDTPFLLRALGYSEEGLQLQCRDLVELLRGLGANLKCFHHTREEVVGVLENEAARLRAGTTTVEPVDYQTSRSFTLIEVEEMIVRIDETLGNLGIRVVDTPTWTDEPDEIALDEEIQKHIDYARPRAREKDVQSLAAVARIRGCRRMGAFESAKAIFVTTNMSLARASSIFFRDIDGRGAIPTCMPVEMMTRLAWVKKPMAAPELPKHMVIAASYAALNPPAPLWREYLEEIARRRGTGGLSDAEYHLLRSSLEARRALMDETFGDEHAFSAGTLDEVLAHAKASIQAEAQSQAAAERKARRAAERRANVANKTVEGIVRAHHARVDRRGRRRGALVGWGVAALAGAALVIGVVASIPGAPLIDVKGDWRYVICTCVGIFIVFTIATSLKGITVFELRRGVSRRVEHWICKRGHRELNALYAEAIAPNRARLQTRVSANVRAAANPRVKHP
jgi:hypothetical protein